MLPIRCPQCGSQRIRKTKRQERPDVAFTIKAIRICDDCGTVFDPPAGWWLRGTTVGLGVLSVVVPWFGVLECVVQRRIAAAVFDVIVAATCVVFGLEMIRNGLRRSASWMLYPGDAPRDRSTEVEESVAQRAHE